MRAHLRSHYKPGDLRLLNAVELVDAEDQTHPPLMCTYADCDFKGVHIETMRTHLRSHYEPEDMQSLKPVKSNKGKKSC
jgi:hypothetical protein